MEEDRREMAAKAAAKAKAETEAKAKAKSRLSRGEHTPGEGMA